MLICQQRANPGIEHTHANTSCGYIRKKKKGNKCLCVTPDDLPTRTDCSFCSVNSYNGNFLHQNEWLYRETDACVTTWAE